MNTVRAVVVGIESYAAGDSWQLDGPAKDAERWVDWLRRQGVPAGNITTFISALGPVSPGIEYHPATDTNIYAHLTSLRNRCADPLVIFWSGHGMVGPNNKHLLFLANARPGDYVNLDFSQLLEAMRTTAYAGYRKQVFCVDACANYVYDAAFLEDLPKRTVAGHTQIATVEQLALFAARHGQNALNDRRRQAGLFCSALLERLDSAPFDNDLMQTLVRETEAVSQQLASEGHDQRPVYSWSRDFTGNERSFGSSDRLNWNEVHVPLSPAQRIELAGLLLQYKQLLNVQTRNTLVLLLPDSIQQTTARDPAPRNDLLNLLDACDAYRSGIRTLLDIMGHLAGPALAVESATKYYRGIQAAAMQA